MLFTMLLSAQEEKDIDDEYNEEKKDEKLSINKNPEKFEGTIDVIEEGNILIVYGDEQELSRMKRLNNETEIKGSGINFFVLQDNQNSQAIIYNHLCKEIARLKLSNLKDSITNERLENVDSFYWEGTDILYNQYDFRVINRAEKTIKFYNKQAKYLYTNILLNDDSE